MNKLNVCHWYSIAKNQWRSLPCYPEGIRKSSLCDQQNQWLINLETQGDLKFRRLALRMPGAKWEEIKYSGNASIGYKYSLGMSALSDGIIIFDSVTTRVAKEDADGDLFEYCFVQ